MVGGLCGTVVFQLAYSELFSLVAWLLLPIACMLGILGGRWIFEQMERGKPTLYVEGIDAESMELLLRDMSDEKHGLEEFLRCACSASVRPLIGGSCAVEFDSKCYHRLVDAMIAKIRSAVNNMATEYVPSEIRFRAAIAIVCALGLVFFAFIFAASSVDYFLR